ncbi:MAG: hypothetical protein ACI4VF_04845 [Lachnospirales bacterium]
MKKKIVKVFRVILFGFCIPYLAIAERIEKPKPIRRIKNKSKFAPCGLTRPVTNEIYKTVVVED